MTIGEVPCTLPFREWQAGTDQRLPASLHDYLLLDLEHVDIDGHRGVRRLAHHVAESGDPGTMEQWGTLVGTDGITLTISTSTVTYGEVAGLTDQIAASLHIGERTPA